MADEAGGLVRARERIVEEGGDGQRGARTNRREGERVAARQETGSMRGLRSEEEALGQGAGEEARVPR